MNTPTHMTNAQGHLVPMDMVKPEDKLENDVVLALFDQAKSLNDALLHFKTGAFADIYAFLELLQEKYKAQRGGKKGNMTFLSYDGLTKVQVSVAEFIAFGPQLAVAKDLIDECIREWGKNSNDNIRVLVDHAFRVDKNNRVNTAAILGLRRLPIKNEQWNNAMDAISESMRVCESRQYIRFYNRPSPEADWKAIKLDLASV